MAVLIPTALGLQASLPSFLGDDANAKALAGLTLNQGAADDEILALKSSDVAHGVTTVAETDTYAAFRKTRGDNGGLEILALDDAMGDSAFLLSAIQGTTADTTKSTSGRGVVRLNPALKNGTGVTVIGANGNLATIENSATTRFIFDAEGDFHADSSSTTF